jgi:hypothetical protein
VRDRFVRSQFAIRPVALQHPLPDAEIGDVEGSWRTPFGPPDSATQSTECADQTLDQINFRDFRRPMAPLLPLPSETSARPTGSSQKNLYGLPCSWKRGWRRGWRRDWRKTHDLLLQHGRQLGPATEIAVARVWRPVIGVVLPPLWHRGHKGQPRPRTGRCRSARLLARIDRADRSPAAFGRETAAAKHYTAPARSPFGQLAIGVLIEVRRRVHRSSSKIDLGPGAKIDPSPHQDQLEDCYCSTPRSPRRSSRTARRLSAAQ